jgi:phosphoribosylformylglycinamidine synthase
VPDAGRCVTAELVDDGNLVLLLGATAPEFAGSHLDAVVEPPAARGAAPQPDPAAPTRYRRLHAAIHAGLVQSCHDVSEGGLAAALAELCIAGRLGIDVNALPHEDLPTALFAESTGRFVVEVRPDDLDDFLTMAGPAHRLGVVTAAPVLVLPGVRPLRVDDLAAAFAGASGDAFGDGPTHGAQGDRAVRGSRS